MQKVDTWSPVVVMSRLPKELHGSQVVLQLDLPTEIFIKIHIYTS